MPVGEAFPPVSYERLMAVLHVFLDRQFGGALKTGRLRWPLLTSDGWSDEVYCLFFDCDVGVLRVLEQATGLVFYVAFESANLATFGIFIPNCMTVYGWSTGNRGGCPGNQAVVAA